MPDIPDKPTYSHGSTGTEPSSSIDYANQDAVEADNFDYLIYTPFTKIKGIIDFLNAIDSDADGQVDAADEADALSSVNNADIMLKSTYDTDDNDVIEIADQAKRAEVRTNDPSSPADGQMWIRSDL
jgi:hypothetical protein